MVCDRPQLTTSVWTLLKSINARFLIPYRPHVQTLPEIMGSGRMSSTTVDGVVRHDANACKGVSENATLILDCWHTVQRFGTVLYRIVMYRDILCSIVSYPSFSPTAISCHHYQCSTCCATIPPMHSMIMIFVCHADSLCCVLYCVWHQYSIDILVWLDNDLDYIC